MQNLTDALKTADDEYLIGLSNKGTLKRAYKDMETAEISSNYNGESAEVCVSGEKCRIVSPLGESQCSCPSRSICRHIITSVLWLKQNMIKDETDSEEQKTEEQEEKKELDTALKDELSLYPLNLIQKAMKKQYYNSFIKKAVKGVLPKIEESSIVSVTIPEEDVNVRLIYPIEYSACTCHSKELCRHKAAAILTWQIKHKITVPQNIEIESKSSVNLDIEQVHDTAKNTLKFLSNILSDGLVRISEDIVDQVETTAVMCHNARLADSERLMREIGNRLEKYISHSPEFNAKKLFSIIMENIVLLMKIIKTDKEQELIGYMGEFKSTYTEAENLEIIPIASRYFSSEAGYEGNIYYFINKSQSSENRFLTYSDVRPTYYDSRRKSTQYSNAPWGLFGNMQDIIKSELRLENPKLSHGKISSSGETKATVIGKRDLNQSAVYNNIYTDFRRMMLEITGRKSDSESETDRLVLISPSKCVTSSFDEISQSHKILIEDRHNNRIVMKARYKAENKEFVERLNHIGKLMMNNPGIQYVIFASVYIENGNCCLYPIAIFDDIYVSKSSSGNYTPYEENMEHYKYFSDLFYGIQNLMCDVIQCGINSFDIYEQIKDNADECRKMGLLVLESKLNRLYELLKAKNHTYSNDNTKIIKLISEIYCYLETGIRHTEVKIAINNMKTTKE